jgi:ribosomal protein S17E
MKRVVAAIALLLTVDGLFGQSDYIVTLKSDTLRGEVRILSYDVQDRAQLTVNGKKQLFTALQVSQIYKDDHFLIPVRMENTIRFMQVIKKGYLSLYGYKQQNQSTYDGRFLVKQDGSSMDLPNITFKKMIAGYVEDCPTLSSQVKNGDYSRRDIEQIVEIYNNCVMTRQPEEAQAPLTSDLLLKRKRTEAIEDLVNLVKEQDFENRQDALDLLADIQSKIDRNENVSNYQVETLRNFLAGQEKLQSQMEKVIGLLKKSG